MPNSIINLNHPLMKTLKIVNSISGRSLTEADLKRHRAAMERAGKIAAPKGDVKISGFSAGGIACERIDPEFAHNPCYAIMYAHGGGYVSGSLSYARILAAKLACATGFTTYSFDYRLAPENPYPAALEDALAVWDHLTQTGYSADAIFLAGESAGGNLVLCLAQSLMKQERALPFGMLLFSPWTDMTSSSDSYEVCRELDPILTKDYVTEAAKVYIGGAGEPQDPRFSPLFGPLKDMPPVYIMAGRNGILLDDSIKLRDEITRAGGKAELDIEEDGWHVYQQMPVPIAHRAMKRVSAYVTAQIYGDRDGR